MNAQLTTKIVFWLDTLNGQIKMGLPEEYPAPDFHEKIVCNSAHEAELWSEKMRQQEAHKQQMEDAEREEVEGRIRRQQRDHIYHLMTNARNNVNREFLRRHLELYDKRADRTQMHTESYLHAEAYEKGR
jgi:hypothetical protein